MSIIRHTYRHLLGGGLLATALAASVVGLPPATPASADATLADLAVTVTLDPTEIPDTGGWSTMTVDLRNIGGRDSQEIGLAITLPAGAWFATDGYAVPESWQCNLVGTATCTRAPLAPGESAEPLSIPFGMPAGTAGDTHIVSATATGGPESSTTNNTGQAEIRYIPGTVDLEFTTGDTSYEVINGEAVGVTSSLRNSGNSPSGDVTVTVPLPAGMTQNGAWAEGWDCAYGDQLVAGGPGWSCTRGSLRAGESSSIGFYAYVSGATPGDVLTLRATASTTSTETTLDNNSVESVVTVLRPATIRGTVWVDSDRDGVRDPEEPGAPAGSGGIDHIVGDAQTTGQPGVLATVNPDGTYVAQVRPGTHRIEFYVHYPYNFIDSVDSDLIDYRNDTGGINRYGYSDWVTLAGGEQAVIDAAVR